MYTLSAHPLRLSARDAHGYDSGRIHLARMTPDGRPLAACGAPFGANGTAEHRIGPTCRRCAALARGR